MPIALDISELDRATREVRRRLLAARTADGYWVGQLSSSALSTATATFALHIVDGDAHAAQVRAGLAWLVGHQNADGGWGDTVGSISNLST
ncbi:MAG: squalene--hopene cyclase, partial [Planctomycetaceae bacterium]